MKLKKINISILSTVLTLSLLLSVFSGFGIATAAEGETASEWQYEYTVVPNVTDTTTANYYNAENLGDIVNDFRAYAWNVATDYTTVVPLATDNWPRPISANSVRQNVSVDSDYRNAGYLDLQIANTAKPVAMTHKAEVKDFYLEMDIVVSSTWNVTKGIMIAPAGEFALVNSDTVADKGVYISMVQGVVGIGGAIDPSTAAIYSSNAGTITTDPSNAGGCFASAPMKAEESKARASLFTWAADSSLPAVSNDGTKTVTNAVVTYCVEIKDGVISVWEKNTSTKKLAAKLTDEYVGGQISFVSTSQAYNAFAGMRLRELAPETAWEYAVTRNTTSTAYVADNLGEIPNDFLVYKWNVAETNSNSEVYANPTLEADYPQAVSATTMTANSSAPDYGYLDFLSYSSTSYSMAMTHQKSFDKEDDFTLEMDILITNWMQARGIMIAPSGVYAINNDDNAANDTGVYIGFNRGVTFEIGGAIKPETETASWTTAAATTATAYTPTKYAASSIRRGTGMACTAVSDIGTNMYQTTICVTVKDGVLSVWHKDAPNYVQTVELSDSYAGGSISYVAVEGNAYNCFMGMRLRDLTRPDYAVTQNTTDESYTVDSFANIAEDFKVYNWNIAASGDNVAYYAPTLTSGFPKAVDATTVTVPSYNATTNEPIRNFGYMDIAEVKSGTVSAMTHWKTLDEDAEYLLEMDFVVRKSIWSAPKGLMIAPAGEFAVSNDGVATNEKGIYISFDAGSNLAITGAVKTDGACTVDTTALGASWDQQPFLNASNVFQTSMGGATLNTYTNTVTDDGGKAPYDVSAGIITICVEVRDGILTVWPKHNPAKTISVVLSDAYVGGNVSYVAASHWDHAFVGMRLTEYAPMQAGTVAINDQTGIITVKGVEGKELKAGSLIASNYSGTMQYSPRRVGFRVADQTALYQVVDANGAVVTDLKAGDMALEFIEPTLDAPNIGNVGTSHNSEKVGLRFISRFARIQDADTGIEYVMAGGQAYEITDYGMLLSSQVGLDTTDLSVEEDMQVGSSNGYVVKLSIKEARVYYDLSKGYVDMAVTVVNIDALEEAGYESPELMELYARAYVTVKVSDTETRTLYGDVFSCAYADVCA